MTYLRYFNILLIELFLIALPIGAQEVSPMDTDSLITLSDTVAVDSVSPYPEWYVAPEIPVSLRAPKRATASGTCSKVTAIQTYNIDSKLVEGTYYEYDNAGRTISTTVWLYIEDNSKIGKSRLEYGFDVYNNQVSTVVYDWDNTLNIWHGVSRYEYVYDAKQRMLSNTEYAWITNEWKADSKKTWKYDNVEEDRVTEYFEYKRNTSNNELQYSKGFIKEWDAENRQTLDIQYTSAVNNVWTAGTKKIWEYDVAGNNTLYEYYASISNGNWIGDTKETWTYGGPSGQLTLHEQFGWTNDWTKTLREETEYSGANIIRIENYTYAGGVPTGTKKEEYFFVNNKPTQTLIYAWLNGGWVGSSNETWVYGGPTGQLTLHEKFNWDTNDWTYTLKEETEYSGGNIVRIENYIYPNGVKTGTQKELTTYVSGKKTQILTFAWENDDWVNSNKETWEFNGPSSKETKHEKCEWGGSDWTIMLQENTTYNGNTTTVENYERIAGTWTGTKKEENTVVSGKPSQTIIYAWDNGAWVESSKETWTYASGKTTSHEKYVWENNEWKGTEKEVWGFTNNKETLHETYEWYNNDWSVTLRELSDYDAVGNKNSIENYTGSEGVLIGTQKEEYTFNNAKEVVVTIKYKWEEGIWIKDTKNEVGYTEGNIVYSEVNYSWNGSTWVGTGSKTEITTEGGKTLLVLAYTWNEETGDWGYNARRVYEYDNKGREVGDTTYHYINSQWENYKLQTHGYDSRDHDTLAITATWNGTEWEATYISKGTYTYTAAGNPLLVETYTGTEGNWTGGQKIEYSYIIINNEEKLTLYWQYQWKNGKWVNKSRTTQNYDDAGHIILNLGETWSNNKWVGSYKFENSFDSDGNQTMQAQYSWSGSTWKGTSRADRGYVKINGETYIAYTISYSWKNNNWAYRSKTEYIRDDKGRVIDCKVYSYSNNTWENSQWNTYVYDSEGQEISSWEYYWIYDQWLPAYCNEKTYDDDNKIRREILGTWNVDVLQSYTDNYYFYNCDPHFYTVGFMNHDGKGLAYQTLVEGEIPEYYGATPTKPSTAEYTYTFEGWTPEIESVTGDATYTAKFTETKNKLTITWKNDDGTTIDQTNVEYGEVPQHADATKEASIEYTYTFAGWDPSLVAATADATYTATYTSTVRSYTITWLNEDGVQIDQTNVNYGTTPTHANPDKAATAEYTYTFKGWDPAVVSVIGDATYTAKFDSTKNSYTITWLNWDNSLFEESNVEYGVVPSYNEPTKAATDEYTYSFTGWEPAVIAVLGDATYTAQFDSVKNSYTITWLNADGSEIDHQSLEYGVVPTHNDAEKEATAEWTYSFTGWDPAMVSVIGDATYTAQFDSTKNSYTITWRNDDGSEIEQETLEYGSTPAHADIDKENTDEWTYTFAGWTPEIVDVVSDASYTAQFDSVKNSYTITWLNEDNSLIDETTVEYGVIPTHDNPTKDPTTEFIYTFAGWTPEVVAVIGNATYTATFTEHNNQFTITFLDEDGTTLQSSEVEYGETPVYEGETPAKEATAEWTYNFAGWDPAIVAVMGDATYTAKFDSTKNAYTITWRNWDDSLIDETSVDYGDTPEHNVAVKEATAEWTYTFTTWDPEIVDVVGDATYTALFDSTRNSYTITWRNADGSEIEQETLEYGSTPAHADIDKEATAEWTYSFLGWEPEITTVTGDANYKAIIDSTKNSYTVTWLNADGSEIEHETLEYGATPEHADIDKEATAEWTYTFAGWDPAIVDVVGDAFYKATFDSVKNTYTITWRNADGSEINHETLEYGATPEHEDATKEATAEWTYTFAGWDPAIVDVVGDAFYKATFDSVKNTYTITWLNADGSEIEHETLEYGATPVHDNIEKEATAEWTYTFTGWDPAIVDVIEDAFYKATFDSVKNTYTITWLNADGSEIEHETLEYGATPEHSDIEKEATAEWTYSFTGWDPAITEVVGDATYTAQYDSTKNTYTITWLNADGSEIDHESLEYGATPEHEDVTKEATAEWTYIFTGWDPAVVIVNGDATYKAIIDSVKNTYTITWLNWDNSQLDQTPVEYGVVPTHDDPTKETTAEWTYTFAGWDPEVIAVIGDASYTATFDSVKNTYTITWLNDDNSLIDQTTEEYGATPDHDDAVKEATAEWTYTFTGWDPAITEVTGEATYTAQFDSTKNSYTITWLNDDGTELDHETLEYGSTPAHADIDKEATAEWTYTFTGWEPEITTVTGDATYTAQFDSTKNSYTITWLNWDESLIDESDVEYGVVPTQDDPTKEATDEWTYNFTGWDPEVIAVIGEATYTAQFDSIKNTYTITWLDDQGAEIDQTTEEYGATPTHDDAVKEATAEWTYTFTGWDPAITEVTGNATYTAQFDSVKNSYTITWLNEDGTEIDHETLEYGSTPTHADIEKENTAEWTYTFAGWEPEIVDVVGDATYTAQFDSVKNSYTITWLNWDESLIDESDVEYGVVPTHDDPTKDATDEYTYTFAGWNPAVVAVTGEATYTAQFDSVKNTYTITWLDDQGAEIDQTTEEYGATPDHDDVVKEATAEWTYTFTGWEPTIVEVVGDATYTAQFDSTKNSYTITWLNNDGSEIDHETLEYGSTPAHTDIDKENTAEYTYTFAGWDPEIVDVVGDATYTAQFDSVKNSYTITWLNWDNSLIDETNVEYGVVPTHDDPTKEATDEWTYTFAGWDPELTAVIGDASYTATFDSVKNTYTITWLNDDNSLIDQTDVEYGDTPTHDDAVKEATAEWTYSFTGWDPAITEVTGEATYTAQFDSTKNSYTVTWLNDDGTELNHETLEYGSTPAHADIEKENTAEWTYTFAGWEPEIVDVVGDATYTATFDSVKNSYTITWLNWDNSLIDQTNVEYGVMPTHEDPTKAETEKYSYTFAGWDPEVVAVIGNATYTATFDSTETTIYYHISITVDDAAHGKAGFVYADSESSTLLTDNEVASGTWIELRAIASDDWHFDHWSDGDTASVRPMEVTEDMQFTAYFASNCGDYPTLPVVSLYDWLLMLDVRSIHAMGYTFSEEDVVWYHVNGEPDKESDGAQADDERLGTGYSFTLNESLINSGDYYATVDVSSSPAGRLCPDMMRSKIVHFASTRAAMPPMLTPALVRPSEPQLILRLDPEFPTTVTIYDLSGHLLRTFSEEGVDRMELQAESVAGSYHVVVQNGDLRTVLRYIVVQ